MIKQLLVLLLVGVCGLAAAQTQVPPLRPDSAASVVYRDSASLARWRARTDSVRHYRDSVRRAGDSLQRVWIGKPDPRRPNQFVDSLVKVYTITNLDFPAWAKRFPAQKFRYDKGKERHIGEPWLVGVILSLLLFFALLKRLFSKEVEVILQSLISNRIMNQISKDGNIFASRPFVLFFILFGFTIGTLLYLAGRYFQLSYSYSGIQWLCILSLSVIGLFAMKIVLVMFAGFLFDVQKPAKEYASILYLTYFNAAILYLPLIFAFALTPERYAQVYLYIAIGLLLLVFCFQFLRAGANILSGYKFPIMYLIIYLCALEVCPLLILIKALRY